VNDLARFCPYLDVKYAELVVVELGLEVRVQLYEFVLLLRKPDEGFEQVDKGAAFAFVAEEKLEDPVVGR